MEKVGILSSSIFSFWDTSLTIIQVLKLIASDDEDVGIRLLRPFWENFAYTAVNCAKLFKRGICHAGIVTGVTIIGFKTYRNVTTKNGIGGDTV